MINLHPLMLNERRRYNLFVAGESKLAFATALEAALTLHFPQYEENVDLRTRISVIVDSRDYIHDFIFRYQELFDNSYWRIIDLSKPDSVPELHRPQFEGMRKDFVDIEWEFVIGRFSNPIVQHRLQTIAANPDSKLVVALCFGDDNKDIAERLSRRLNSSAEVECVAEGDLDDTGSESIIAMAKRLHYFYIVSNEIQELPVELPEEEVEKEWARLDDVMRNSNIYNVKSIPVKMKMLGHDKDDLSSYYALSADEIDKLTAAEHNRWTVERLIQGFRPCTGEERREIEEDLRLRFADAEYAKQNPVSLKRKYKTERNAHYDLCAYTELGVDETGLPVTRYDRDLTAAIPLIAIL